MKILVKFYQRTSYFPGKRILEEKEEVETLYICKKRLSIKYIQYFNLIALFTNRTIHKDTAR